MPKPYTLSLPFDESYAWEHFIEIIKSLKQGEKTVFYGLGSKRLKFRKLGPGKDGRVLVTSQALSEIEEQEVKSQRKFEKVFMSSILKEPNKHFHRYERSATKNVDWQKQVFRCVDPDCNHYTQAQFIIGKRVQCHKCGNLVIAERQQIKNHLTVVGLCCSKSKRAKTFQTASEAMSSILGEFPLFEEHVEEAFDESHEGILKLMTKENE